MQGVFLQLSPSKLPPGKILTGLRPADVLAMRRDDIADSHLRVRHGKIEKKLRIQIEKMAGPTPSAR